MKKIATVLAAGAFALFAGSLILVETAEQANAAMRGGGGGSMRSMGGGGGRSMMGSNVSARHISTSTGSRRINTGTMKTTKHISTTRVSKHVGTTKSGRRVSGVNKTNTSKLSNVRKPNIGKQIGTANLGTSRVNTGNTKSNTGNIGKLGPGGIKQGPGNKLAGGPAGLGKTGPGSLKVGPGGLKQGPVGGLKPPPGGFKPAPGNIGVINGRYVNIFRGPRQIWWAGAWVSLAALAVIPAVWIAGLEYEPWGYVALAEPVCSGVTPEGYRLTWRDVPTDTGVLIPQCVAYYPRGRAAPAVAVGAVPGQAVGAAQPVAAAMAQGCLVEIYSQVAFTGMSSDVAADQPRLSDYGWDKQISSLDVKSGTWDFYSESDYGGQMVRLPPGQYQNLEGWDKQISSFMCTQPK
jgi:beta/gamma crystallin